MPCDKCSSSDCCDYYLFFCGCINFLCYDCSNKYDSKISSKLIKKATHFYDVMTGISYPF